MATAKKEQAAEPAKRKIRIDLDSMSLGDLEAFEDATGLTVDDVFGQEFVLDENGRKVPDPDDEKGRPLMKGKKLGIKAMIGLIYVVLKREDPTMTPAKVRALGLDEFEIEDDEDPTEAASGQ